MLLAEGPNVVAEVHAAGATIHEVLHTPEALENESVRRLVDTLTGEGVEIESLSEAEFAEFATTVTPTGILAVVDLPRRGLAGLDGERLLVLDAVQDPGNVGTLIRAAEVLGADAVVLLPGTADPWSPKVTRAAAGATFRIPLIRCGLAELRGWCEERGLPMFAAAADGEPAPRAGSPVTAALVVGNESAGVSPAARAASDRVVAIRQKGATESLNVAVAGAILMDRFFGG